MSRAIRIVLVEDIESDVRLIELELKRAGLDATVLHVDTEQELVRALRELRPDVVLSDHALPQFSAGGTLGVVRTLSPDTPVIVVTGSLDEETAVEYIKAGATDYVIKQHLERLPPAVLRALALRRAREDKLRAEAELRRSEVRHKTILDAALDAVITIDAGGAIVAWNPRAEAIFGWPAAEVLGRRISNTIIPPRFREAHERGLAHFLMSGEGPLLNRRVEVTALHREGREFPVELAITPVPEDDRWTFTAFIRDLSEQRVLETRLRQSQKMEAVGRLAGGIAHDFNNLLTAITGYCDLLRDELGPNHAAAADVHEIRRAGERAAALTRQLLAFSRQQVLDPKVVELNQVVQATERLLARVIGEDVELATRLAPDLGRVKVDPGQMEQVLMNLVVNARDAMPQGGKLTIETQNVELEGGPAVGDTLVPEGRYVLLAVTDTGIGMDAATQAHIFEPFFTTKQQGRGTGLGLATVYGIVKQSGGFVWVYSEPGKGATFKIYLPRVDEPVQPERAAAEPTGSLRGTETVLLVEDEDGVRAVVRQLLERQGYTVLDAADAEAGRALAAGRPGPIHLLVTDVVLRGMSGRDLATRLAAGRPEMRVLYMSGYAADAVVRHGTLEPGLAYIQKPFTPDGLARKVRAILDANQPRAVGGQDTR
jgi:PAS domain S-box-containing protein